MFAVRRRLVHTASEFLRESGLTLSLTGQVYLSWLLTRASLTIVSEAGRKEDALRKADEAVQILLATAGGLATGVSPSLGLFLLTRTLFAAEYAQPRSRITARDLRAALAQLCPIWPFCKRRRVA